MDGAYLAAFLEMYYLIKDTLDKKNVGLKIEPNGNEKGPWDIICFSYSNYVDNPTTKSASRFNSSTFRGC